MKLNYCLSPYMEINSKQIINLNADPKYETIRRIHKGNNLIYWSGKTLMDKASKPHAGKAKIDQ
jgi:hypothetical protein